MTDQIPVSEDTLALNPALKDLLVRSENGVGKHSVSEKPKNSQNKYHAVRTWSELCRRTFDSKAEAARGEELYLMEKAGHISDLRYQVNFILCNDPKITVTIDFSYCEPSWDIHKSGSQPNEIYEDVKGVLTRDSRTRYAWLKEKYGIEVRLVK